MSIGQFRRHLETLPDDALVVFQSENPDTSLTFPAMVVSFTVKPILLPDGKVSILAIVGLSPDNRGCSLPILTETEFLYKGVDGFYMNIVNHRLFDRLPDDGLVMFSIFSRMIDLIECSGVLNTLKLTLLLHRKRTARPGDMPSQLF